jgi:hypothetical protein
MARINQIRDVIVVRQQEDRKRDLTYKEIEVQALLGAIHGAAGNAAGVKAAATFRFHREEPEIPSSRKVAQFFRADAEGLFSEEELAAEVERQRALL